MSYIILGLLVVFGLTVIRQLTLICSTLEEIKERLPGEEDLPLGSNDEDRGWTSIWREAGVTMNRIARIYDKFVLGKDYAAEGRELRERLEQRRSKGVPDSESQDSGPSDASSLKAPGN